MNETEEIARLIADYITDKTYYPYGDVLQEEAYKRAHDIVDHFMSTIDVVEAYKRFDLIKRLKGEKK